MARLHNNDIHSSATPLYGWGLSLDLTGKGYEVSKRTWDTYENALAYVNDSNDSAAPGNILTVVNDTDTLNGVYLVLAVAGYKLAKTGDNPYYSIVADATVITGKMVKLGDANDLAALKTSIENLRTLITEAQEDIDGHKTRITANEEAIKTINTTIEGLVPNTRTIAGIDLKDNITKEELATALGVDNLDYVTDVQVEGKSVVDESGVAKITLSDLGLTNALHFVGVVTELPATGSDGDVVLFGTKEYVYSAGAWVELGDEGSHALKTVKAIAGEGLAGGGDLSKDFTFSLDKKTVSTATADAVVLSPTSATNVISGVEYDDYGRVAKVTTTPIKVQDTVVSSLSNNYVQIETSTAASGEKKIDVSVAISDISAETVTPGLADTKNVKDYVDEQIRKVSGDIPAITVSEGDFVTVTETKSGVATDYKVSAKTKSLNDVVQGEDDALAKAQDVKAYVDAQVDALEGALDYTTVGAAAGGYVTVTGENRKYTVGVSTSTVAEATAAGKVADAYDVKTYVDNAIGNVKQATVSTDKSGYLSVTQTGDDYKVTANVASSITSATARGSVADAYDVKQAITWTEL